MSTLLSIIVFQSFNAHHFSPALCVIPPKKSMPLSTGGDLSTGQVTTWTKIHLKKSHLAQGPEASS
jgi:purine-cytosine permease-like protein